MVGQFRIGGIFCPTKEFLYYLEQNLQLLCNLLIMNLICYDFKNSCGKKVVPNNLKYQINLEQSPKMSFHSCSTTFFNLFEYRTH